jgi:NAD(P)-dependent dehydrogenase (short-subunit alcohol dehydrogenase family)
MRFEGKVAVVTGAARGIGAATARRLVAEGASVVLADIDDAAGRDLASELGERARFVRCDVSHVEDWRDVASAAESEFGGIDVVHNNAYTVVVKPTHELTVDEWHRQLDVCLTQVFLAVKTCMPRLIERSGTMVNTSSIHALVGFPQQAGYDAAKGGVSALTRELAAEYGPRVRVNAVLPGAIDTAAWDGVGDEDRAAFSELVVAKRFGTPEEVAAAVCFLASDEASYITGQNLVVDGGFGIWRG